jgi:hypothetical protein
MTASVRQKIAKVRHVIHRQQPAPARILSKPWDNVFVEEQARRTVTPQALFGGLDVVIAAKSISCVTMRLCVCLQLFMDDRLLHVPSVLYRHTAAHLRRSRQARTPPVKWQLTHKKSLAAGRRR